MKRARAGCGRTWEWVEKVLAMAYIYCTLETRTLSSSQHRHDHHHREPPLTAKTAPSRRERRGCAAAARPGKANLGFPLASRVETVRPQNHASNEGDGTHRCHRGPQRKYRAGLSPEPNTAQRRDGDAPKCRPEPPPQEATVSRRRRAKRTKSHRSSHPNPTRNETEMVCSW